jgi:hypothetical protein
VGFSLSGGPRLPRAPLRGATYPLACLSDAFERTARPGHLGKIVVEIVVEIAQ